MLHTRTSLFLGELRAHFERTHAFFRRGRVQLCLHAIVYTAPWFSVVSRLGSHPPCPCAGEGLIIGRRQTKPEVSFYFSSSARQSSLKTYDTLDLEQFPSTVWQGRERESCGARWCSLLFAMATMLHN